MLKLKIKKDAFDALSEDMQKLYKADGDDFLLAVDGLEDTGALKRAKDREVQARKDAQAELKAAQEKLAQLEGDDARKKGDIETLEKSWNKKFEDQKAAFEEQISSKNQFIQKTLIDGEAVKIANEISTSPALILPHIKSRLSANLEGDSPVTQVLDADGKPSALTLEELSKEFVDNKDFASIIVGSKASGSGTPKSGQGSKVGGAGGEQTDFTKMSPKELAEHVKLSKQNQE
jgi:hypothetical protein